MKRLANTSWGSLPSGNSSTGFLKFSACILLGLLTLSTAAERVPPGTDAEISERLEPVGSLCLEGDDCGNTVVAAVESKAGPRSGKQIYDTACTVCHAIGVSGAPKFGNAEDWAPRVAKGMDALWLNTQNGFNVMPPRGTCMDCSDAELKAAMEYMTGSF